VRLVDIHSIFSELATLRSEAAPLARGRLDCGIGDGRLDGANPFGLGGGAVHVPSRRSRPVPWPRAFGVSPLSTCQTFPRAMLLPIRPGVSADHPAVGAKHAGHQDVVGPAFDIEHGLVVAGDAVHRERSDSVGPHVSERHGRNLLHDANIGHRREGRSAAVCPNVGSTALPEG
jgi:hypothetical protein